MGKFILNNDILFMRKVPHLNKKKRKKKDTHTHTHTQPIDNKMHLFGFKLYKSKARHLNQSH